MKQLEKEFSNLATYLGQLEYSIQENKNHLKQLEKEKKQTIEKMNHVSEQIETQKQDEN